jgi:hypothetical protein
MRKVEGCRLPDEAWRVDAVADSDALILLAAEGQQAISSTVTAHMRGRVVRRPREASTSDLASGRDAEMGAGELPAMRKS